MSLQLEAVAGDAVTAVESQQEELDALRALANSNSGVGPEVGKLQAKMVAEEVRPLEKVPERTHGFQLTLAVAQELKGALMQVRELTEEVEMLEDDKIRCAIATGARWQYLELTPPSCAGCEIWSP